MRVRGFLLRIIVAAASLCLYVSAGLSQQFPSKPVRLLIPVAPGGGATFSQGPWERHFPNATLRPW